MPNGLINRARLRALAREEKPGLRISTEYVDVLEEKLRLRIQAHIRANNSKRTLMVDVFDGVAARGPKR